VTTVQSWYILSENVKWCIDFGKQFGVLPKRATGMLGSRGSSLSS
jgi:hypothetical protein